MAIEFHCERCGKMVRAPDDAGGKHGKCPGCHQSVYIPTPSDAIETLDLAPVDEAEEARHRQEREEDLALQKRLMQDKGLPESAADERPDLSRQILEPKLDMDTLVIEYANAMAKGDLAQAEQYAGDIRADMAKAREAIQRLMSDEILPEALASIPRPVLVGFFKQLSH